MIIKNDLFDVYRETQSISRLYFQVHTEHSVYPEHEVSTNSKRLKSFRIIFVTTVELSWNLITKSII